jgi:hypothetical protein
MHLLRLPELLFQTPARRDDLREKDQTAYFLLVIPPRVNLPAQPVQGPVSAGQSIFFALLHSTIQTALEDASPPFRHLRKDIVVAVPDHGIRRESIVRQPPATAHNISEIAVKHRGGHGQLIDKESQLVLATRQY